ncbi:MAG: hypothetical protein GY756_12895 [bacterium]|nr:hypothetical protein [bacterium]
MKEDRFLNEKSSLEMETLGRENNEAEDLNGDIDESGLESDKENEIYPQMDIISMKYPDVSSDIIELILRFLTVLIFFNFNKVEDIYSDLIHSSPELIGSEWENQYNNRAIHSKEIKRWLESSPPLSIVDFIIYGGVFQNRKALKNYNSFIREVAKDPDKYISIVTNLRNFHVETLLKSAIRNNSKLIDRYWCGEINSEIGKDLLFMQNNINKITNSGIPATFGILLFCFNILLVFSLPFIGLITIIPAIIVFYKSQKPVTKKRKETLVPFFLKQMVNHRIPIKKIIAYLEKNDKKFSSIVPYDEKSKENLSILSLIDNTHAADRKN